MLDFAALPPEINSGLMYSGAGSGPMLSAAAAWDGLAAELGSTAASYQSVIAALTAGSWQGPASAAMAAAAATHVVWLNDAAAQAEQAGAQAAAAAGAYEAAFAATVPPTVIEANRTLSAALVATNFLGQNTPAIMATEALYLEMWAQDAATMFGYASASATASTLTPFTAPTPTASPVGVAAQAAAVGATTASSAATNTEAMLTQLTASLPQTLGALATGGPGLDSAMSLIGASWNSTGTAITLTGPLGDIVNSLTGSSTLSAGSAINAFIQLSSPLNNAVGTGQMLYSVGSSLKPASSAAAGAAQAATNAARGVQGAALKAGAAGLGNIAGTVGEARSVGGLSVPANWGWAATAPPGLVGMLTPAGLPLAGSDVAAGSGFPIPLGGIPRTAAAGGAGVVAGAVGAKYLPRLKVLARSPGAGYSTGPIVPAAAKYPVPVTFPTNGHAPPGYQPAIVYLPTNGNAPANV